MQINMLVVIVRGPKREVPRRAAVLRSCHSAQLDRYSDKNDFANFERLYRMSLYSGRSLPTRRNCSISFKIKAQYLVFRRQKIPIFGSFRISKSGLGVCTADSCIALLFSSFLQARRGLVFRLRGRRIDPVRRMGGNGNSKRFVPAVTLHGTCSVASEDAGGLRGAREK